jgi:DNA-binding CsgD family transcriptional regulator
MNPVAQLVIDRVVFPLQLGKCEIGRSNSCKLQIKNRSVSRHHAVIAVEADQATVFDRQSLNGTFVDGDRVERRELRNGAELRFGTVPCLFAWLTSDRREMSGSTTNDDRSDQLSPAESTVYSLLLRGMSEKAIAAQLCLSRHTVHNHIKHIYQGLGVHTRAELMVHGNMFGERRHSANG